MLLLAQGELLLTLKSVVSLLLVPRHSILQNVVEFIVRKILKDGFLVLFSKPRHHPKIIDYYNIHSLFGN